MAKKEIKTKLIFTPPEGAEMKFSLSREGEYSVGTSSDCDITIEDDSLEKEHANLVPDETNDLRWFLQINSSKAIHFLEDGTSQELGKSKLRVRITEEEPDRFVTEAEAESDNESQLEELKQAQQMREFKSATILVIVFGLLGFAAGVAFRIFRGG